MMQPITDPAGQATGQLSAASRALEQRQGVVWPRWVRLVSLATIVVSLVVLVRLLPVDRLVAMLTAQVEQLGFWGPSVFGGGYVLAAVLFVPGSALTLAAGAVFGLWWGTAVVSIASTTAAAAAFLMGRYVARDAVGGWAARSPKFAAIDRAIGQGGWKIIALLRLSPAVPFSLGNYLFGLTSIRFWPYVVMSWLAMLPGTFMYVYLGFAGRAGLTAAGGGSSNRSPGQWALLVVGLLATVAVTIYLTRIARKAIKGQTDMDENHAESSTATGNDRRTTHGHGRRSAVLTAALALAMASLSTYACTRASSLANLFGPPQATLDEAYTVGPDCPTFDHSLFNDVLREYVSKKGGWVDYARLTEDHAKLDRYIASLASAPFGEMGRHQKLALLINAYNAFTLRLILDHYPVKSIKNIPAAKRWDSHRWNVSGHVWSLNQIEHEQIRPKFKEPRIHFALVCAAVGCPPLRHEAYTADRLQEQLQAQAVYVHAHARWFHYEPPKNRLWLTSLYDWYGGDFEQVAGSVLQYAARYSPQLRQSLEAGRKPKVEFLDYDWSLNGKERQ